MRSINHALTRREPMGRTEKMSKIEKLDRRNKIEKVRARKNDAALRRKSEAAVRKLRDVQKSPQRDADNLRELRFAVALAWVRANVGDVPYEVTQVGETGFYWRGGLIPTFMSWADCPMGNEVCEEVACAV